MTSNYKYICPKDECTGCMACINTCAHSAIEKKESELGFLYPIINTEKCISCGMCYRVCPQLYRRPLTMPSKCLAGISKNYNDYSSCASGGIATVLSRFILQQGGFVVGCDGTDINNVHHRIIDTLQEIENLKGSKYVQSFISSTLFKEIRSILLNGKLVLFIGTACQVAGLLNFLIKEYPNLYTIDLVCHGVPSQKILSEDLNQYSKHHLTKIRFRRKVGESDNTNRLKNGESIQYGIYANQTQNGIIEEIFWRPWYKDPYLGSFISGISFREGCYKCLYARSERQSDLTICDFWGLNNASQLYNHPGVSAILINSQMGLALMKKVREEIETEERPINEAIKGNGQLQHPSPKPSSRNKFISEYSRKGIKSAYRKTVYLKMLKKHLKTVMIPYLFPTYNYIKKYLHK